MNIIVMGGTRIQIKSMETVAHGPDLAQEPVSVNRGLLPHASMFTCLLFSMMGSELQHQSSVVVTETH